MFHVDYINRIFQIGLVFVALTNVADTITTAIALGLPNNFENNPLMAHFLNNFGVGAYVIKAIAVSFVLPFALYFGKKAFYPRISSKYGEMANISLLFVIIALFAASLLLAYTTLGNLMVIAKSI